jgi:hypothetical protein
LFFLVFDINNRFTLSTKHSVQKAPQPFSYSQGLGEHILLSFQLESIQMRPKCSNARVVVSKRGFYDGNQIWKEFFPAHTRDL